MEAVGPMLAVHSSIAPHRLADLSFLQIVDHYEYLIRTQEASSGRQA